MKILVTGGSGFVGWRTTRTARVRGHDVSFTYHTTTPDDLENSYSLDVREHDDVRDVVEECDPDVIIHTAAMTDVDACENQPEVANDINVRGTRNILRAASITGASVVLLSSAFVFDGTKDTYRESDERNPINHYGRTKLRAEQFVSDSKAETLIVRTDQPYGWPTTWQEPDMVTWILDRLESSETVPVFEDWYNTPVYVEDLAEGLCQAVELGIEGVLHLVGPDYLNRYRWARRIAKAFEVDPDRIRSARSTSVDLPADRPNVHLSNQKARDSLDGDIRGIETALEEMARRKRGRE